MCNRISKLVGFLRFSKQYLDESHSFKYYNCYVKPIIEYAIIVYDCVSKNALELIFNSKKCAVHINYKKPFGFLTNSLFQQSKIYTIFELYAR